MPKYGFFIFFSVLSYALVLPAVRQVKAYKEMPCMSGMMVGMTLGMVSGFLLGFYSMLPADIRSDLAASNFSRHSLMRGIISETGIIPPYEKKIYFHCTACGFTFGLHTHQPCTESLNSGSRDCLRRAQRDSACRSRTNGSFKPFLHGSLRHHVYQCAFAVCFQRY